MKIWLFIKLTAIEMYQLGQWIETPDGIRQKTLEKVNRFLVYGLNSSLIIFPWRLEIHQFSVFNQSTTICLLLSLTCLMVSNIYVKKNILKQNNSCYLFGMYDFSIDSVIVNVINDTYIGLPITISCEKYNLSVLLDTPDDIVYLYPFGPREFSVICWISLQVEW